MQRTRDPRTKEELLDRMLARDFDGDITHLGAEPATLERIAANKLLMRFPKSGRTYELVARLPRTENRSFTPSAEGLEDLIEPVVEAAPEPRRRQAPAGRNQDRSRPSPRA